MSKHAWSFVGTDYLLALYIGESIRSKIAIIFNTIASCAAAAAGLDEIVVLLSRTSKSHCWE